MDHYMTNEQIIDIIENGTQEKLNEQDSLGFTLLHDMIERKQKPIIKMLLNKNVNTKIKTSKGHNAIELAQAFIRYFQTNFPEQKRIIKSYEEIIDMLREHEEKIAKK